MTEQRRPLLLTAAALAVFVALLVLVAVDSPVTSLDQHVYDGLLRRPHRPLLDQAKHLTDVLSPLVDVLVLGAGAAAVTWRRRELGPLVATGIAGWFMVLVVVVVKHAVGRPNPSPVPATHGGSFPSGHTAAALVCFGALALLLALERPRWLAPMLGSAAVITALLAGALVYSGYHWLSDTVASIALGVGVLVPLHHWLRRRA